MGAQFGPYGAAAGGILGGLGGLFSDDSLKKIPTMTKEQKKLLSQQISQLMQGGQLGDAYTSALGQLQQLLDPSPEAMEAFTAPYMRQFEEQTVPGLAEKFAGAGATGGALSSSGFGQALGAAGAGLQENLANLKANLQQQAISGITGQYQNLLGTSLGAQPFGYQSPQGGFGTGLLSSYASQGFTGMSKIPGAFGMGGGA